MSGNSEEKKKAGFVCEDCFRFFDKLDDFLKHIEECGKVAKQ